LPEASAAGGPGGKSSLLSRSSSSGGSAGGTRRISSATIARPDTAAKIVIDTSVLIKWFKTRDEDLLTEARALLEEVGARPLEVHVPALLLYEVGNILLLKTQLGATRLDDVIDRLEALPFIVAPPATPLLRRAARLGRELGLTFYDASFLALAVELDCPYVTADRRLFERAGTLPRVHHLSRVGALS
jgi:predicted nucleic acid-binding protein